MLEFIKADKYDLSAVLPYFAAQNTHLSDFSAGYQFMWNRALRPDYAFCGDCLVLREYYTGKYYFHYPLSRSGDGAQEEAALSEIERYCRDNNMRLHFTNAPRRALGLLAARYGRDVRISNPRSWRDYLYFAEDFKQYAGGKYAGQRNHVNKFKKSFPDWAFRRYTDADEQDVWRFLREYEAYQQGKGERLAREEMAEVYEILPRIGALGMFGGILTAGGKIAAFTVGERCGDMIVVHIEKALREFPGAYPCIAQQFALAFCGEGATYLNRMDDAGDMGLRKSKLQYLPCEVVDKYTVIPARAIDGVSRLPEIGTERLTLAPVSDGDGAAYARLAGDTERNRYWGYDYREDYKEEGTPPPAWFLSLARDDFHNKSEMPLGIYCGGELVGETVLHRFGYRSEAEIGVRLLPEAEGKGYAAEAVRAYAEYAFEKLGLDCMEAKCFRENARSEKMLLAAGFRPCGEDETYFRFYKTPAM